MIKFSLPMPGRRFVIGVPYVWLGLFFFLPFLILVYISFVDMGNDISPFKPLWDAETGVLHLRYENYWSIFRAGDGAFYLKRYSLKPTSGHFGTRFVPLCSAYSWVTRLPTLLRGLRQAYVRHF